AEVWMSLIHGAQGIVYFVHQFAPTFREDGIFNYPSLVTAVSNVNAQVLSLAPVLNTADVTNAVFASSSVKGVPVDVLAKRYGGATYVFAGCMRSNSTTATFKFTGIPTGMAVVLGEGRTIPVNNGQFQDAFGGYGVHLYQIASTATNLPPALPQLSRPVSTDGRFQFTVTGTAGSKYVVQASDDPAMLKWTSLATNLAPWVFTETNIAGQRQRFYRGLGLP
ncbi:MAG TPA: hypothetical protein VHI52_01765, partial [Verrucomicrobiae bacterium]|nr:hypothetical protein [Verrucomicrobiae bacterium]